ncbi:MAG: quinolinate synthase NadA, partial [Phycisphaerae bacterium]|nr:quinolinate synthase NadA [Phycisphaerae bacterium]
MLEEIREQKALRRAVILAHNYQSPEIQDLADFCGDSLGLSIQASKTDAETIVFCGVRFMAETAKVLCPNKMVLLPDARAGCPMADMITADELRDLKAKHPDALVVCYVNSTAEVKAESDYCCTSANAVAVVQSLPRDRRVIFVPDQH